MTLKDWFNSKSYWLKGLLIGGFISLIPIFFLPFGMILGPFLSESFGNFIISLAWLPTTIPTAIFTGKIIASQFHGEEGMMVLILFPISIILNIIIGSVIGLIIGKFKSK